MVWRVLALYIAVLLFLPAVGGRTGEVVSATRDWQLGWFTGNAAPPPWALMSGPGTARSASFVALPAGKLRMGSTEDKRSGRTRSAIEVPAVQVMSHEVTAAQYRAGCPKEWWRIGCKGWKGPAAFQRGDHPAVLVTWQQASDFCAAHGWRLPTEAEWEYAARGEKAQRHPWGSKFAEGSANYCDVGCASQVLAVTRKDDGYPKTAPVGAFPRGATPEGIHDLAGNVAEWTLDCWKDTHAGRDSWQPWDPEACAARVVRGASWRDTVENQVGWRRTKAEPNVPTEKIGFRCVTGADPTDPDAG